jgi:fluoride exporter
VKDVLWIALGAAVGASLRYTVNRLALAYFSASVPYGTPIVNVTGSFVIGFFTWTSEWTRAASCLS